MRDVKTFKTVYNPGDYFCHILLCHDAGLNPFYNHDLPTLGLMEL